MLYVVRLTTIFPGSQASDFSGSSRAWKINKTQTKRANIIVVQYFCGIWYFSHINRGGVNFFILYPIFILFPHNLYQLPFLPPSPPPPTPDDSAVILDCVPVPPGGTTLPPPPPSNLPILHLICFLCKPLLRGRQETEMLFGVNRFRSIGHDKWKLA